MKRDVYENYLNLLREELIPAMGCTEPIAIAYAAAAARAYLGAMPERMIVRCSGNIIKNVKGVNVPNAGGQKGVETAALLGALAGDAEKKLQVISAVPAGAAEEVRRLREQGVCACELAEGVENLFIRIEAAAGDEQVVTEIRGRHDRISRIEKNGEVLVEAEERPAEHRGDKSQLNLRDIFEFAGTAAIEDIAPLMERQLAANTAISQEGLQGDCTLLCHRHDPTRISRNRTVRIGARTSPPHKGHPPDSATLTDSASTGCGIAPYPKQPSWHTAVPEPDYCCCGCCRQIRHAVAP